VTLAACLVDHFAVRPNASLPALLDHYRLAKRSRKPLDSRLEVCLIVSLLFELYPKGILRWTRHGKRHSGKRPYLADRIWRRVLDEIEPCDANHPPAGTRPPSITSNTARS
jgi:hypothetical protein